MTRHRLPAIGLGLLIVASYLTHVAQPGLALTARTEAEALPAPSSCWSVVSWSAFSGGQARACARTNEPLTWSVSVPAGQQGTLRLYGYRDQVTRGFRARVDGNNWTQGSLNGPVGPSVLFYTSPPLREGSHTIDLEVVASDGGFTFDFQQLDTTTVSSPTTTSPPTTTTPTTPSSPICNINPADGQDAITAAIGSCADGTTVVFPAGAVYHQSNKILVKGRRNLVIDGNGSTFISSAPNDASMSIYQARPNWELVEGSEVTLRNLTVRGNVPAGWTRGIIKGNQYNAGIIVSGGNGVYITDVSVYSVFGEFVISNPSGFYYGGGALDGQVPTNVHVTRLHGERAARQCVAATAAQGFWLEDSLLSDCFQNGVDIEPDVAGERARDVHVLRNTISGFYISALTVPTAYGNGDIDGVELRGNTTSSPSDTCYPAVLNGGVQGNSIPLNNIVVADNTLKTLYDGVKETDVASGSVTGNSVTIVVSPNYCGPPVGVPVRLANSPSVVVSSNSSYGYGQ